MRKGKGVLNRRCHWEQSSPGSLRKFHSIELCCAA